MPNYGTTSITITGPQADRAALRAVLAATAYASLGFSLQEAAPEIWRSDGYLRHAEMTDTDKTLRLVIGMTYDCDCLLLAAFYVHTPERDRAATACHENVLEVFVREPRTVAGWRKSRDDAACTVYLMPNADTAGHLVLVLDMLEGTGTLLRDLDGYGGYRSAETLLLDPLRDRAPELEAEIDRLMLLTATDRQEHLDWLAKRCETSDLNDEECPF